MIQQWIPLDRLGVLMTALLWVTFILGLWFAALFISNAHETAFTGDFYLFHAAANAIVTGVLSPAQIYDADLLAKHTLDLYGEKTVRTGSPFLYPPTMVGVMVPLGFLEVVSAHIIWGGIIVACAGLSAWLLGVRGLVLAALAINPFTLFLAAFGQTAMFPVLALSIGLRFSTGRANWAGAALFFMTLKPQLALAGPLLILARRSRCMFIGYIAAAVISIVATTILFGWQAWWQFASSIIQFSGIIGQHAVKLGYDVFLTAYAVAKYFGAPDQMAKAVHACSIIIVLGMLYLRPSIQLIVVASLVIPVYNLSAGYALLLVPAVFFLQDHPRSAASMATLVCYALLIVGWHILESSTNVSHGASPPVSALCLWVLLIIVFCKSPSSASNYPTRA